jgi:transcriptional regulator with XRE-family HTH domain
MKNTDTPTDDRPLTAEVRLASRLRQFRIDKGLKLKALAEAAAMSQALLSRMEHHKVSVSIAALERLSKALGVPMSAFFEENDRTLPITVCRAHEGAPGRIKGPGGYSYEMLASKKGGKMMEPLIVDLTSAKPMALKSHPGEEFDYVLEGECTLLYGRDEILLRPGDSAYYDATVPHAARPVKDGGCRILVVVASRDYVFHGDLTLLLKDSKAQAS